MRQVHETGYLILNEISTACMTSCPLQWRYKNILKKTTASIDEIQEIRQSRQGWTNNDLNIT
jgi:hypothetical protein